MNTIIAGFIGPQEIIILLIIITIIGSPIYIIVKAIGRSGKNREKSLSKELDKQFNRYHDSLFTQKDIKDYYPVKEGNKITLIRFDEIVDFSADNYF